jgi:hypothetical protein
MKTTVEISDDLFKRSQQIAKREGTTLRAILEEGLRLALRSRQTRQQTEFQFPTFGKDGLNEEFRDAPWESIRDAIYRDTDRRQP